MGSEETWSRLLLVSLSSLLVVGLIFGWQGIVTIFLALAALILGAIWVVLYYTVHIVFLLAVLGAAALVLIVLYLIASSAKKLCLKLLRLAS